MWWVRDEEARSLHDVQRHAGRPGGHHLPLRVRQRRSAPALIGLIAGILVVESVFFFDKLGIDDPVGAISVHGVNGAWGCLSLGLFADGTYGDGWNGAHWFKLAERHLSRSMDPSAAPKGCGRTRVSSGCSTAAA